jgi:hypothetical protein
MNQVGLARVLLFSDTNGVVSPSRPNIRGYELNEKIFLLALAAIGSGVGFPVHSATTWTFDVPPPASAPCTISGNTVGNNVQCTAVGGGAPKVVATAWANSTGANTNTSNSTSSATLAQGTITVFANSDGSTVGLGARNSSANDLNETSGSPEHAIDNNYRNTNSNGSTTSASNGMYDSILLSFDTAVALTGLTIGWPGPTSTFFDTDVTISAYTGTAPMTLTGRTYASLTGAGWGYVEHYADLVRGQTRLVNGATQNPDNVGTSTVTSRFWMISAYNPTRGGNTSNSALSIGNDYFKLLSVVAAGPASPPAPGRAPEPAALSLLAVAALGATAMSRRRKAVA